MYAVNNRCLLLLLTFAVFTYPLLSAQLALAWKSVESGVMRQLVLREGVRADGRSVTDIRPITSRAGVLPRTHGSSLFTRGETQVCRVIRDVGVSGFKVVVVT
jgi:polyribonucleotide nucleotidyltransferase